jgi:acyl phosphate:glycerol-3-phosphate acyltransferase
MIPWLLVIAAYLLGAVPASYLAGRWAQGIDLREHGSGNLGATNTFRVLGARVAAPVMVFDVLKGMLPVLLFPLWDGTDAWEWRLAYGGAAIVGHVFSVYMRFRGGKGVATSAGVFLGLAPLQLGVGLAAWLLVLRATRMVSAASIAAALTVGVMLIATRVEPAGVRWLGLAVVAFVVLAHRTNIARIMRGEEARFHARSDPEATVGAAASAADGERGP